MNKAIAWKDKGIKFCRAQMKKIDAGEYDVMLSALNISREEFRDTCTKYLGEWLRLKGSKLKAAYERDTQRQEEFKRNAALNDALTERAYQAYASIYGEEEKAA